MKKKLAFILILLISLYTFTGCASTGIDGYSFITALGIDLDENDTIKVSVQVSSNSYDQATSSQNSGSSQSTGYKIYSCTAKTIDEGITILNNYLTKPINLTHCSAIIISEELAKKGIQKYITTLGNNSELKYSAHIIISSTTAFDIMDKVNNSGEAFSARLYDYLTTTAEYTGYTVDSDFGDFFKGLDNGYYEPCCTYSLVNNNTIQSNGIAVFKDEFMVGHLNVLDSVSHLLVTNKLTKCSVTIDSPFEANEKIDIDINLYKKTKIEINMINSTPYIVISVYPEGKILGSGNTFNYVKEENIKKLETSLNNYFSDILKDYLYKVTKTYDSDICGFRSLYKSQFLTKSDFDKMHFDEVFKDSFFDIKVNSKIKSSDLFNKE